MNENKVNEGKIDEEAYLILLLPTAQTRKFFYQVSLLANFYLHPLRFVGSRLDCTIASQNSLPSVTVLLSSIGTSRCIFPTLSLRHLLHVFAF